MDLDYNGYWPDGRFGLQINGSIDYFDDLNDFRAGTSFETHGVVLSGTVFATAPPASENYRTLVPALDFALHAQSAALDKGVPLATINDGYSGGAPDLGAAERGVTPRIYGSRTIDIVAPAAPTGLTVQ